MKCRLRTRRSAKLTPRGVIQSKLADAYAIHPGHLMPGAVISALEDAGFLIMSHDELENDIAFAFQAGVDSVTEA